MSSLNLLLAFLAGAASRAGAAVVFLSAEPAPAPMPAPAPAPGPGPDLLKPLLYTADEKREAAAAAKMAKGNLTLEKARKAMAKADKDTFDAKAKIAAAK